MPSLILKAILYLMGEGKYYYSPEEAEYYKNDLHAGNTQYIPMNEEELMRFFDYIIKKNLY